MPAKRLKAPWVISTAVWAANGIAAAGFNSSDNVAVYWGQNSYGASSGSLAQQSLATYCANTDIDIIPMAFLIQITTGTDGKPVINFANSGNNCSIFTGTGLLSCPQIGDDIQTCQQKYNKTILLSIGGATYTEGGFSSSDSAVAAADLVWETFGPAGNSTSNTTSPASSAADAGRSKSTSSSRALDATTGNSARSTSVALTNLSTSHKTSSSTNIAALATTDLTTLITRTTELTYIMNSTIMQAAKTPTSKLAHLTATTANTTLQATGPRSTSGGQRALTLSAESTTTATARSTDAVQVTTLTLTWSIDNAAATGTTETPSTSTALAPGRYSGTNVRIGQYGPDFRYRSAVAVRPSSATHAGPDFSDAATVSYADTHPVRRQASALRPFGDAVIDGFDLDLESANQNFKPFADRLRDLMNQDTSKEYYITAAPQCPYPDAASNSLLNGGVEFDAVFVQFYNNYCGVQSFSTTANGTQNNFNFETWDNWAKNGSANAGVKVFLGVPAGQTAAGSGYLPVSGLTPIIDYAKGFSSFGGVMMWDASQAYANAGFLPGVKSALQTPATRRRMVRRVVPKAFFA